MKKRIVVAVAAVVVVGAGIAVVASAVGSRLTFTRIENVVLADGAIQVQVAEAAGTTSTGSDHNVFVAGSGLAFEADRAYAVALYTSQDCSTGHQAVAPWLPQNSQLRTVRGNAPPGSRLDSYGSVGVTFGEADDVVVCTAL